MCKYKDWMAVYCICFTIDPGNADRLAEGEEEQGGSTANMMVQQLEQVYSPLKW